ncbi:MAG TPA: SelT/SelW/SelH family protein [Bacteroidetes bacterium]|nr:SelT/SelW/SelH family protein [Bacteroidota bacterium]HEX04889.1 SelT/SelW/SelH family protein [Bacteroidota bacterium]
MAVILEKRYVGSKVDLIRGSNGVFDVTLNGTLLFSKDQAGRFPEDSEVLESADKLLD